MMEKLIGNLRKGLVFVLSAPAGTGKTTLSKMLTQEFSSISKSISCTTRPKRGGEIANKDYYFMREEEFTKRLDQGEFLEHARVFGNHYGTLRSHVEEINRKGKHAILVIDTQGAMQLKNKGYQAIFIFIYPPSMEELRNRLIKRRTEAEAHVGERLHWAEKELMVAEKYDYIITNDYLDQAYEILRSIFIAEEHRARRYHDRCVD